MEPYRTLLLILPGTEGTDEDEFIAVNTLLPPEASIDGLVCQETYPNSALTAQHENAANIITQRAPLRGCKPHYMEKRGDHEQRSITSGLTMAPYMEAPACHSFCHIYQHCGPRQ
jgi:hypothetical protein